MYRDKITRRQQTGSEEQLGGTTMDTEQARDDDVLQLQHTPVACDITTKFGDRNEPVTGCTVQDRTVLDSIIDRAATSRCSTNTSLLIC